MKTIIVLNTSKSKIRFPERQVLMAEAPTTQLAETVQKGPSAEESCSLEEKTNVIGEPKTMEEQHIPKDLQIVEKHSLFSGRRFSCPWGDFPQPRLTTLLNWRLNFTADYPNYSSPPEQKDADRDLPIMFDCDKIANPPSGKLQATWIGHSTVLVQLCGVNILTDPVFCNICGPIDSKRLGYERYRRPACTIGELPTLDAVVISHDHFDHLDKASVQQIYVRFPDVCWILPEGMEKWFRSSVNERATVTSLTWWEEHVKRFEKKGKSGTETVPIKFVCTPAQHWCGRIIPVDKNKRLWCSWVVQGEQESFYFAGDTGYHAPTFQKIGELYGPFSLAAIPIGAYEPRNILVYQHVNPIESVKIHKDVKAEHSIAIHWGTFATTNEFFAEPPQFLKAVMDQVKREADADKLMSDAAKARLDPSRFTSLHQGQTWVVGESRGPEPYFMTIEFDDKRSHTMKQFIQEHYLDSETDAVPDDS